MSYNYQSHLTAARATVATAIMLPARMPGNLDGPSSRAKDKSDIQGPEVIAD